MRALEKLFSFGLPDGAWLRLATEAILELLGPAKSDWWGVHWELDPTAAVPELATTVTTLVASSPGAMKMGAEFPATTHPDLQHRIARQGGLTTVTAGDLWTEPARDLFSDIRSGDAAAVAFGEPTGGVVVGRLLGKRTPRAPGDRRILAPVIRSIRLSWTARRCLELGKPVEMADAILTPSGSVCYAKGAATRPSSLEALRAAVVSRERSRASRSKPVAGNAFWSQLVSGRWSLMDDYEHGGKRYILAVPNAAFADMLALNEIEIRAIESAILGRSVKESAACLGLSLSRAYAVRQRALEKLGLRSAGDLMVLGRQLPGLLLDVSSVGAGALLALGVPVAASRLSQLTGAEREVGRLLAGGLRQRDIARRRGRSVSTIANQVRGIYGKLGVSGRAEFLAALGGVSRAPTNEGVR